MSWFGREGEIDMKIVHVVRQFYPAVGGLENVVLELAAAQVVAGHLVKVITLDRIFHEPRGARLPALDFVRGIEVIRIPFVGSFRYPIAPSVLRHIGACDLVHVHAIDFFFDFLGWTKWLHRRNLVVSTHGGFFHTGFAAKLKEIYFKTMTWRSMRSYGAVIAVSPSDEQRFQNIRHRGLVCLENGVDIAKYADTAASPPTKTIVVHGRWSSNKRLDRVVAAVAELRKMDADWNLVFAGRPWDVSAADLSDTCNAAGLSQGVTIVTSPSEDEMRRLFRRASLAASASSYEGFGIAAVEAMSAGLLPVLNDIPAHRNLVMKAGVGVLTDFANAQEAALAIRRSYEELCCDHSGTRTKLMQASRQYGWAETSQAHEQVYSATLGIGSRSILGVPVRVTTFVDAVAELDHLHEAGTPQVVVFANANCLNHAVRDRGLRLSLQQAVVLNDGVGLDIASKILFRTRFPANLNGTDFVPAYLRATRHRSRIYLLGSNADVVRRAADVFQAEHPRHAIVGYRSGYFREADEPAIIDEIKNSDADLILVGMGNPRQEIWLAEHLGETGCKLGFAVGALFDFVSGGVMRAPVWVRRCRLEWLFRMCQEPRRLSSRYMLGNPKFIVGILQQWWEGARV